MAHPLKAVHLKKRKEIRARLADFRKAGRLSEEDIFLELVFCLLTPQSRARAADAAVTRLRQGGRAFSWAIEDIRPLLVGVRFPNNKSRFVFLAREVFRNPDGAIEVKSRLPLPEQKKAREWLVKNVKGLGMKEASHFLRNIGHGGELAILDVHVLRRLHRFGVIEKFDQTLSRKEYLEIEEKMRKFSGKIGVPLEELDLLLWSDGTGEIFK
jgi:N-glycosylase/DNA lyase